MGWMVIWGWTESVGEGGGWWLSVPWSGIESAMGAGEGWREEGGRGRRREEGTDKRVLI